MKKCKECGQLFMPKSTRSQYCDRVHYRPCPICGKLVEAKYLSDPARCCSKECQQASRRNQSNSKPAAIVNAIADDYVVTDNNYEYDEYVKSPSKVAAIIDLIQQEYNNEAKDKLDEDTITEIEDDMNNNYLCMTFAFPRTTCKFETNHRYALLITHEPNRPYLLYAIYDFTLHQHVHLNIHISSTASINNYFHK